MKKEVNPKETSRSQAFELWMEAPNPMVTFFKTIDVTREGLGIEATEVEYVTTIGLHINPCRSSLLDGRQHRLRI